MSITSSILGGLDVGNGYVKGILSNRETSVTDTIDIPSGVRLVARPNDLPVEDNAAVGVVTGDFFNDLDLSFDSPLVNDNYRRLFGTRSLSASGAFEEFDVVGNLSKAEQPLSKILVLGLIAGKAVRDYVAANKALPPSEETLSVKARIALALPITEYMSHRHAYAAAFKSHVHTVTVRNFTEAITVKIKFEDVQVIAEGASAQYAITDKGEPLAKLMLADVRKRGMSLTGVSAADVLAAKHTVGIDVGEGTVNFPVFTHGRFNADASRTFNEGYGTVLTNALSSMESQGFNSGFTSRKQLADYLQAGPSALKRNFYERVAAYVTEESLFFCQAVAAQLGRVLAVVGAQTEVAYVYGGGAGPIKEVLYPLLMAKAAEMNTADSFPVLYLDSTYSRQLNREGLYLAAQAVAASARKSR